MKNTVKKFCRMISHFVSVSFIFITFLNHLHNVCTGDSTNYPFETTRLAELTSLDQRKPLYPIVEQLKGCV